ncbi:TPA: hypothetical protein I7204_21925 [Vibrio vulnificus]|uniref:hypothetical protein n=1 Tax=Vibrio TaxID=662 RepID=UPI0004F6E2A9|nr:MULTISPECIES: hypothetical protein [Vibrio]AIL70761.1 hypothetical protein VV93_v1c16730 [Vibrio vulnificus]MBE3654812.1 hypothetical protein [Vibrio navarrensis]PWY26846.1 hypothetical protein VV97_22940 [Vibrio vulnificus]HAT8530702.1 hypothetical protein [Vibrio vulnificus]HDY7456904.1 hypothetical protein [Vibrio vulnificus]
MSVEVVAGITLIDFLNKSLETLKLVQQDSPDSLELQKHLVLLTQQLSKTMVEASQLQGILAQKNEEIRQLKSKLDEKVSVKYDSKTEVYWADDVDSPYCPICYESDGKLIHLSNQLDSINRDYGNPNPHYSCKNCGKSYYQTN